MVKLPAVFYGRYWFLWNVNIFIMKERALVIVAHNDDEVLGCGGFIKQLRDNGWEVGILIMTLGTTERGGIPNFVELMTESHNASVHLGAGPTKDKQSFGEWGVIKESFRDQRLDEESEIDITKRIEMHVVDYKPQLVLTHFQGDLNKDHEIVSKCVKVACRSTVHTSVNVLMEFPVISSSNFNSIRFEADTYIEISKEQLDAKITAMKCYKSEYNGIRQGDSIEIMAKYFGYDVGYQYAEVFKTVRTRIPL